MSVIAHIQCRTVAATEQLATQLAVLAAPGDIIALSGGLGAGKTTFTRAFVHALTNANDDVPSPTFTLVQIYDTSIGQLWHCDLYRLATPDDARELGLEEAFSNAICVIEWPERLGSLLPVRRLALAFNFDKTNSAMRQIEIEGDARWAERLKRHINF